MDKGATQNESDSEFRGRRTRKTWSAIGRKDCRVDPSISALSLSCFAFIRFSTRNAPVLSFGHIRMLAATYCQEDNSMIIKMTLMLFLLGILAPFRQQGKTTYSVSVDEVQVVATVRDDKGRIRADLNREDFILEEEGKPTDLHSKINRRIACTSTSGRRPRMRGRNAP